VTGGANLVFAHAYAEVPTRFGGLAFAARRSWLDGVLALALSPEAAGIAPRFWDASAQATIGRSSVLLLGSYDAIDVPSFSGDGVLDIAQESLQVQARVPLGDHLSVQPWVAWNHRTLSGELVVTNVLDNLYPGLRVEAQADAPDARLQGGIEAQRQRFAIVIDPASADAPVWTIEPYAAGAVGDRVQLWDEARLTAVVVGGEPLQPVRAAFTPRGGVRWRIVDGLVAHADLGRLSQLPPSTLWLPIADGPYLDLERSDQLTLGASFARGPLVASADLWRRTTDDLAQLELDGSVGEARGRASGLDAEVRWAHDGVDASLLYAWSRSELQDDPDEPWLPSPFDTPHRVDLLVVGSLPRAQTVSARVRYTSGYPRLPDIDGRLQPVDAYDLLKQAPVALNLPADQQRLDPFYRLDLRYARLISLRRWRLEVSVEVQNVTNRRVVEPVIAGFGEARPSYGFGLPVLPIFGVEGQWAGSAGPR
jgi:hypothetical protein